MVVIIDYGMGNIASVQKALDFLNIKHFVSNDKKKIAQADFILLPGVGSFLQGMTNLRKDGLDQFLSEQVLINKKKFIGICLGMQLISEASEEPYDNPGLGWIKGKVKKITDSHQRVPHMGWNNIEILKNDYFDESDKAKDFYFIHSYHFDVDSPSEIAATVEYETKMVAAVQSGNIFATQFHPEKSQTAGLELLKKYFQNA